VGSARSWEHPLASTLLWHAIGKMNKGSILALTGKASAAVQTSVTGISEWRQTGGSLLLPWYLSNLAMAYGELGQFDDAWRSIGEAITAVETTKETWCEAEVHRTAGEIALKSPEPDTAKAQGYFERALAVARGQPSGTRLAIFSLRSLAGSPKASTRSI